MEVGKEKGEYMSIYEYEEAFGSRDVTSDAMRRAIEDWFGAYYGRQQEKTDPCQRIACAIVSRLTRAAFGEYQAWGGSDFAKAALGALEEKKKEAMQLALVGGSCLIKPCLSGTGFSFTLIPRTNALIFGRDGAGNVTDMGTVERSVRGGQYYTLLERRRLDENGCLVLENSLYRSKSQRTLGAKVALKANPAYASLVERYRFPASLGLGVVEMRTGMVNCVDGTAEPVSIYAPALGLMRNLDENEAQLRGEFQRGQSRILVSADLLGQEGLQDNIFVGLDEAPEHVGMTVFAPQLREQSFLARKQEYLRNIETLVGLKRGALCDANEDLRTATEITSSAADYNLTVMELQQMWEAAARKTLALCGALGKLYGLETGDTTVSFDWGNGVLHDEDKTWEDYRKMVSDGLLRPEIALGWRFNMPAETQAQQEAIRQRFMPA